MTFERAKTIGDMVVASLLVTLSLVGHLALSSLDTRSSRGRQPSRGPVIELQDALLQPEAPLAGRPDRS